MKKTVDQSRSVWMDTSKLLLESKLTEKITSDVCVVGEHAFDAVAGGHLEKRNDALAGLSLGELQVELLPHPAVRLAREERVAEDQPLERLGLALEGIDKVSVIDHPAASVDRRSSATRQREHERA